MEFNFGQPNSLEPQYGNTGNLGFSNSDPSGFDFSGVSPPTFTAAMPTTHIFPPPCMSFSSMEAMRESIYLDWALHSVPVDEELLRAPPERKKRKLSKAPQSVVARERREKISTRLTVLGRMVPGGTKMDTASMLEEAYRFVSFLKRQVELLEQAAQVYCPVMGDDFFPGGDFFSGGDFFPGGEFFSGGGQL